MRFGYSKRYPWPYDIAIGGTPLMLSTGEDGNPFARRAQPLDAVPSNYQYGTANPFVERNTPVERLIYGMGQRIEPPGAMRRYWYADGVDMSIDGQACLGPLFTADVALSGPVRQFIKARHTASSTGIALFALAGSEVFVRNSDATWGGSLGALSGGGVVNQAARFKPAGAGAVDALYVTSSNQNVLRYTGSAWEAAPPSGGPISQRTQFLVQIGDALWFGWDNQVAFVESDPFISTNFSGEIQIGDGSAPLTWLGQNKGSLYAFKEDSIYTINEDGTSNDLYPSLRLARNANNGRNTTLWSDQLWVPWNRAFYRLAADGALSPIGTEYLLENGSPVNGQIVATAGHNSWFLYEALYNGSSSFLGKFGTWFDNRENPAATSADHADVHHFALKTWPGKQITAMEVISGHDLAGWGGDNDRLYVGFADGTVEYTVLPRFGPNPAADGNCQFVEEGEVYFPEHNGGFQADPKFYVGFAVYGPRLSTQGFAEVHYRPSQDALYQPIQRIDNSTIPAGIPAVQFTLNGQRAEFEEPAGFTTKSLATKLVLKRHEDAPITTTPIVTGVAILWQLRPETILEWKFTIDAKNNAIRRNGTPDRRHADQIRAALRAAIISKTPVRVTLPDGSVERMTFINYEEPMTSWAKRYGLEWTGVLTGIQIRILSGESFDGLTYGVLEQFTYGELEQLLNT